MHRALYGRIGVAPLFGVFFAYNANFIWGFFNYDFSAGLAFAMFAAWIATDGRNGVARLAGFAVAVTALYFCHIFAVANAATDDRRFRGRAERPHRQRATSPPDPARGEGCAAVCPGGLRLSISQAAQPR